MSNCNAKLLPEIQRYQKAHLNDCSEQTNVKYISWKKAHVMKIVAFRTPLRKIYKNIRKHKEIDVNLNLQRR